MFFICLGARPARNEREARKSGLEKQLRAFGAFAGGTPAVPDNHLTQ